ncbi:MAG: plastocyanin/azurin family copper-binding protein [Patescibacteria group bacterium]|nr:plastocyanin/azurin family copper-binding protein [Patescibacteria group bacterium]
MKKGIIVGVIVLAVLILGGAIYYYFVMMPAQYSIPMQNFNAVNAPTSTNLNPQTSPMPMVNTSPLPAANLNVNVPPPPAKAPKTWQITIQNFSFNPSNITIDVGDTIKWINDDVAAHQIAGNGFLSQVLNTGDSYSFKFTTAGTYNYHCNIHTFMTAAINVQ